MEGGGFAAARPSIVRKEIGGALARNRGHLPFNKVKYPEKFGIYKVWESFFLGEKRLFIMHAVISCCRPFNVH